MTENEAWPWYETVEGSELEQGDILHNFPVTAVRGAAKPEAEPELSIVFRSVIVLTQTCDIPKKAQTSLLLSQITDYDSLAKNNEGIVRSKDFRRKLVDNQEIAFFLLKQRTEQPPLNWSVASFRDVYVSPKEEVQILAQDLGVRLRLRSPYKEHLAQSFAKFMMRVGLPETTHEFRDYQTAS